MDDIKKIRIAFFIFLLSALTAFMGNKGLEMAFTNGSLWQEIISYVLIAGFAICLFGVILPVRLATRWKLTCSFWPKNKNPLHIIFFLGLWFVLLNYENLSAIRVSQISGIRFSIHLIHTLLLQITYYPLFAMFLFPVFRRRYGLWWSLLMNGVLFTLIHIAQTYLYPELNHSYAAGYLFVTFIVYMLLYIWSESLILVMIVHVITNALLLASKGVVYEGTGVLFWLSVLITFGVLVYMIRGAIQKKNTHQNNPDFWISIELKD